MNLPNKEKRGKDEKAHFNDIRIFLDCIIRIADRLCEGNDKQTI